VATRRSQPAFFKETNMAFEDPSPDPYAGRLLLTGVVAYVGIVVCICAIALGVLL
jgi:hypothetical protein